MYYVNDCAHKESTYIHIHIHIYVWIQGQIFWVVFSPELVLSVLHSDIACFQRGMGEDINSTAVYGFGVNSKNVFQWGREY